ncbi:MAG: lipoate--protein ligase family protein [Verrucomicrobiales bacterium]|nr:lipoate--protein ligase family protein [Verrucomicrobiales bacterium]
MISLVDLTLPTPAENLALDEALLDDCDTGSGGQTLRFWEPTEVFVVVGYGNSVAQEVEMDACVSAGIPVLRRCTGGGTVVQMPGVLNYNLVLQIPETGPLSTLTGTNQFIMGRLREAIASCPGLGERLSVRGVSDLCFDERKVMGSAQRRKRTALVFHGSLLLGANLNLIERFLRFPSKQPDYRANRTHLEFCTNLGVPASEIRNRMTQVWGSSPRLANIPWDRVNQLVRDRYGRSEWNHRS